MSLLLEREEGKEEGTERNIDAREKHRLVAFPMNPDLGLFTPGPGSNLHPRYVP